MLDPKYKTIVEKEGDEKDFEYKGYKCHIRRVNPEWSGHLCGYVEIPVAHPIKGMNYDQIEEYYDWELPTHGGLTFASEVENAYWIGFDCAHLGDLCPAYPEGGLIYRSAGDTYKTMGFVEKNLKQIVDYMITHKEKQRIKLKLIDVNTNPHEAETGTCELCFGTEFVTDPVFTFQRSDTNEVLIIDGYYWCWGDHSEVSSIDNIIDFAGYVNEQEFIQTQNFNFNWLDGLVDKYLESKKIS